jgi:hypothetical protein
VAEILIMRQTLSTSQQPLRYLNGGVNAVGNVVADAPTGLDYRGARSNVMARLGNVLHALTRLGGNYTARDFNPSTGNWDVGLAFPAGNGGPLFIGRDATGLPRAFCLTQLGGAGPQIAYKSLGGAWTLSGSLGLPFGAVPGGSGGGQAQGAVFRGELHIAGGDVYFVFNPNNLSGSKANVGAGSTQNQVKPPIANVAGKLFSAKPDNAGASLIDLYLNLYEFTNGAWTERIDGSGSTPTLLQYGDISQQALADTRHTIIHEDPATGDIILHGYQDRGIGARGWRCFQINPSTFAVTDLTSTVVDASLRYPTGPTSLNASYQADFWCFTDNVNNPASQLVTVYLNLANGTTAAWSWNGVGSVMTALGTGENKYAVLSGDSGIGGGDQIYEGSTTLNPALYIEEVARSASPTAGRMRVEFKAFALDETGGSPATPNEDVEIYYERSLATPGSAPGLLADLGAVGKTSGAGATPTLVGDVITGVDFDGVTQIFADWNVITQGLFRGEFVNVMPRKTP